MKTQKSLARLLLGFAMVASCKNVNVRSCATSFCIRVAREPVVLWRICGMSGVWCLVLRYGREATVYGNRQQARGLCTLIRTRRLCVEV